MDEVFHTMTLEQQNQLNQLTYITKEILMSKYYCHNCAVETEILIPLEPVDLNLSGTPYQLNKYLKHTAPTNMDGFISVFDDPTYDKYENWCITASLSGCVEVDDSSRINVIYYAGYDIGITFNSGIPVCCGDTVKLVLHQNEDKVHGYPVLSGATMAVTHCTHCGNPIIS